MVYNFLERMNERILIINREREEKRREGKKLYSEVIALMGKVVFFLL